MTTEAPCHTYTADDPRDLAFLASCQATLGATDAMITGLMGRQNELRQQLRRHEAQLAERRADLQLVIEGKNAEHRSAALTSLMGKDGMARLTEQAIDEKQVELAAVTVDLDAVTRRRSGCLAVLNYAANWLRYSAT